MCSGEPLNKQRENGHVRMSSNMSTEVDHFPRKEVLRPHQACKTLLDWLVHRRWLELDVLGTERGALFG